MTNDQAAVPMDGADKDLANDFRAVMTDAQDLLESLGNEGGARLDEVKSRAKSSIALAQRRVTELQSNAIARAKAAARGTQEYVSDNPWRAIGIGAGVGVVIGYLAARCAGPSITPGDGDR
ncbi:MAG: DUF883 family protein [Usitatibacter sp.]